MYEVEGLYYLCSKNKGADQLRGYREADLRLCFRICKKNVFLMARLISYFGSVMRKPDFCINLSTTVKKFDIF